MPAGTLLLYGLSFVAIWCGAGLIVQSIDHSSRRLHISSFFLSFFVLGCLTSIPELAVGLTSVARGQPEIFVGNLLGGIPVLLLFVIPLLAIIGGGIRLGSHIQSGTLAFTLAVIAAPSLLIFDKHATYVEGVFLLALYGSLFFIMKTRNGNQMKSTSKKTIGRSHIAPLDMFKLLLGVLIVLFSSQYIVDNTMYFAQILNVSPYVMSVILLSLGTNLPEMSIALRSILQEKKDIAFGDYLGSAAANTFLFGIMTILSGPRVELTVNFTQTVTATVVGLILFYIFSRSTNELSRMEGVKLIAVYVLFVVSALYMQ